MDRRALPVLLASARSKGPAESEPLDRLRMQKGIFLISQRGPGEWRDLYSFSPYNWGPYSSDLAHDLFDLVSWDNYLAAEDMAARYPAYRATEVGDQWLEVEMQEVPQEYLMFVASVRRFVTSRSFSQLLRDVYAAYPAYAVRSRFSG